MCCNMKILFIAVLAIVGELSATKLPEYIKVCKRDKNTINDCVKNSIKSIRAYLPKGIPEINVPSMDPFTFDELNPVKGADGLHTEFKKVQVVGLSDFEIKKLNVDTDAMVIKASLKFPVILVKGQYYIDLRILAFPIKGEGPFTGNITDIHANAVLKYKIEKRQGKDCMKFTSCDLVVKLDDYHIALEGLLGDALGEASQRIIKDNKKELLGIVLPLLENAISNNIVLDTANSIASAATYDELLPA